MLARAQRGDAFALGDQRRVARRPQPALDLGRALDVFARARCGTAPFFGVATSRSFSYLLPASLPPGRYVLDVEASDAAGNQTTLARGSSRIVFYVS